jgi:hypothetical protein
MKEIQKKLNSPLFFISMATAAKFVLPILIVLAHLVPLDVHVTGNITAKLCEVWSEFNIFYTLVTLLVERGKPKSVGQALPQLPWKQKKGDLIKKLDSFHQTS